MKNYFVAIFFFLSLTAEAGRGLPAGEENAWVITRVYQGPFGEVQLAESGGTKGAFLRSKTGVVYNFKEVQGAADCQEWFQHVDKDLPRGCVLMFVNPSSPDLEVPMDGATEVSLFQKVSQALGPMRER